MMPVALFLGVVVRAVAGIVVVDRVGLSRLSRLVRFTIRNLLAGSRPVIAGAVSGAPAIILDRGGPGPGVTVAVPIDRCGAAGQKDGADQCAPHLRPSFRPCGM